FLGVADGRLVGVLFLHVVEADLDRFVAVVLGIFFLKDHAGTRLDDGDRDHGAVGGKDLRHSDLFAQDPFHVDTSFPFRISVAIASSAHSLISMSTPLGRSRRISASTVCGVGLTISINRLCVRISNCSRESLYLCTARRIVMTCRSVGSGIGPETPAPERLAVSTIFSADWSRIR